MIDSKFLIIAALLLLSGKKKNALFTDTEVEKKLKIKGLLSDSVTIEVINSIVSKANELITGGMNREPAFINAIDQIL